MGASRRLFFALWPPKESQLALAEATQAIVQDAGGRPVPPQNFHITLAFLGSVLEHRLSEVVSVGASVAAANRAVSLQLVLDGVEHWKKPGIVVATAGTTPPAASLLADALKSQLTAAGFTPDLKPFRAHVTLVRKALRPSRAPHMQQVPWHLVGFSLIESRTQADGSLYSVVDSF